MGIGQGTMGIGQDGAANGIWGFTRLKEKMRGAFARTKKLKVVGFSFVIILVLFVGHQCWFSPDPFHPKPLLSALGETVDSAQTVASSFVERLHDDDVDIFSRAKQFTTSVQTGGKALMTSARNWKDWATGVADVKVKLTDLENEVNKKLEEIATRMETKIKTKFTELKGDVDANMQDTMELLTTKIGKVVKNNDDKYQETTAAAEGIKERVDEISDNYQTRADAETAEERITNELQTSEEGAQEEVNEKINGISEKYNAMQTELTLISESNVNEVIEEKLLSELEQKAKASMSTELEVIRQTTQAEVDEVAQQTLGEITAEVEVIKVNYQSKRESAEAFHRMEKMISDNSAKMEELAQRTTSAEISATENNEKLYQELEAMKHMQIKQEAAEELMSKALVLFEEDSQRQISFSPGVTPALQPRGVLSESSHLARRQGRQKPLEPLANHKHIAFTDAMMKFIVGIVKYTSAATNLCLNMEDLLRSLQSQNPLMEDVKNTRLQVLSAMKKAWNFLLWHAIDGDGFVANFILPISKAISQLLTQKSSPLPPAAAVTDHLCDSEELSPAEIYSTANDATAMTMACNGFSRKTYDQSGLLWGTDYSQPELAIDWRERAATQEFNKLLAEKDDEKKRSVMAAFSEQTEKTFNSAPRFSCRKVLQSLRQVQPGAEKIEVANAGATSILLYESKKQVITRDALTSGRGFAVKAPSEEELVEASKKFCAEILLVSIFKLSPKAKAANNPSITNDEFACGHLVKNVVAAYAGELYSASLRPASTS
ncbi:unnamed protein product [Amoebophrya sp. A25]|nr:unnamed protein product [Amoebophrya sp. A25]|eukprot:GSA25T00024806001.1